MTFEEWWNETGQETLYALNTLTDADAKILAKIAWESAPVQPVKQEPVAWQQELANILCRIHRDGGHYIAQHGWRKAIGDADLTVAYMNAASDTTPPSVEAAIEATKEKAAKVFGDLYKHDRKGSGYDEGWNDALDIAEQAIRSMK